MVGERPHTHAERQMDRSVGRSVRREHGTAVTFSSREFIRRSLAGCWRGKGAAGSSHSTRLVPRPASVEAGCAQGAPTQGK